MIEVKFSNAFAEQIRGNMIFSVNAESIGGLISILEQKVPGISKRLLDENGSLNKFIIIFKNKKDIRFDGGINTELKSGDKITILQALSGG